MQSAWTVAISLISKSNFGLVSSQVSKQAKAMQGQVAASSAQMNQSLAAASASGGALERRLAGVAKVASAGFTVLGVAVGAAMVAGVKGAADLETAMVGIRNATGATHGEMEKLRGIAFDVSSQTAQSVVNSANIMQVMAQSLGKPAPGMSSAQALMGIARPAAMFADVQFLRSKGAISFEDAARQAIQVAHLYQAYTPKQVEPIFDNLTKLSQMMPDNLNRYLTQAAYYMPLYRRMHVAPEESLVLGAWLDRMGLGRGKGGTALSQFLLQQMQPLQITSHQQGKRADALRSLGLLNDDGSAKFLEGGQFHVIAAMEQINRTVDARLRGLKGHDYDKAMQDSIVDIQKALGVVGGRAGLLGTPEAVQQLHLMIEQLHLVPGMYVQQARYMDTLNGQFQLFKTNVSSLFTDAMWGSLPYLKGQLHGLAEAAHQAQMWVHAHRDETNKWVKAGLIPLGWAILQGGLAAGRALLAFSGIPGQLTRLTEGVSALGVASGIAAGRITAAGAEIGAGGAAAGAGASAFGVGITRAGLLAGLSGAAAGVLRFGSALGIFVAVLASTRAVLDAFGYKPPTKSEFDKWRRNQSGGAFDYPLQGNPPDILPGSIPQGIPPFVPPPFVPPRAVRTGSGHQVALVVNNHYHAAAGDDDATSRRRSILHAREVAGKTATVIGDLLRTTGTGMDLALSGPSKYEFVGGVA
jgi:hypothetical protein